jgi:sulfite oxidase
MNGKPLTANHGAPVRALFPGILGARSVKWLNSISVQPEESDNFYQVRDYKILPPEATSPAAAKQFWDKVPSMNDMPINSIIGVPITGSTVAPNADGTIEVRGYALPAGMTGPVTRVQVSADDGRSWIDAELDYGGFEKPGLDTEEGRLKVRWAWCLWRVRVPVTKGSVMKFLSKATDLGGTIQPRESCWNLRGVGYNAWGEVNDIAVE